MKNHYYFTRFLLFVSLFFAFIPISNAGVFSDQVINGIKYMVYGRNYGGENYQVDYVLATFDNSYTLSGSVNIFPSLSFEFVWYVNDVEHKKYVVLDITSVDLHDCSGVTSITIPDYVTHVNLGGCTGLTSVNWNAKNCTSGSLPSNVDYISIGSQVETIPYRFAMGTKISNIDIPNSVIEMGSSAFQNCDELMRVSIDGSSIGDGAFRNCSKLSDVTIGNSVTTIGNSAFNNCSSLNSITIPNSATTVGNTAFADCTELTSAIIYASTIGNGAFRNCSKLSSVSIGNYVTTIGDDTFNNCSSLKSITIPSTVTSIGERIFNGCSELTSVTIGNSVFSIPADAFLDCHKLLSLIIPNSVTLIGNSAFKNCYNLKGIVIPNSVTSIGDDAFMNCTGLTSVSIGNSVISIGDNAFNSCYRLTSVTIPQSVTNIGGQSFEFCYSLTDVIWNARDCIVDHYNSPFNHCPCLSKITVGPNVQSIGDYIFCIYDYLYDHIDTVECLSKTPPTITENCFWSHTYSNATLCVPKTMVNKYSNANGWKEFVHCIENPNSSSSGWTITADVNYDGKLSIDDVTVLISFLLSTATDINLENADVNGDGRINIDDVTVLINLLLSGY